MASTPRKSRHKPKTDEVLTSVAHFPGYGFYALFGPKPADWEPVSPINYFEADIDQHEINQLLGL